MTNTMHAATDRFTEDLDISQPACQNEQLSALVDGQLQGGALDTALALAAQSQGQATVQLYQFIGDVLRSPDLAQPADTDFLERLRGHLADEVPYPVRSPKASGSVELPVPAYAPAANASVFRWKMAAGFASMAAVAAIGWTSISGLQSPTTAGLPQMAASSLTPPPGSVAPTVVAGSEGAQVMIRDPRLDELLAAHKKFGSTNALQMPATFLRNATFEAPDR